MQKLNTKQAGIVKDIIREPYAWPGGYLRFAVTDDGGVLCHKCLKKEYRKVIHDTLIPGWNTGWDVVGEGIIEGERESEGDCNCSHCGTDLYTL